jgi:hypothetical protein
MFGLIFKITNIAHFIFPMRGREACAVAGGIAEFSRCQRFAGRINVAASSRDLQNTNQLGRDRQENWVPTQA